MARVLVLTPDPKGARMGGAAQRATELARVLCGAHEVTLAAPGDPILPAAAHHAFDPADGPALRALAAAHDVVVTPPLGAVAIGALRRSGARLVADLYDPVVLEVLEAQRRAAPRVRRLHNTVAHDALIQTLRACHHAICASERQRDLWLGVLLGVGLLGPGNYDPDPTLRSRLDVVPIGISTSAPAVGAPIRERFPEIPADAPVALWFGGLWNWVDPVTAVKAFTLLRERRPEAHMVIVGRPPVDPAERVMADAAAELAGEHVHRYADVVPYEERGAWLTDADVAISTHLDHVETRFAFRTRILDYVWAGLPTVCTSGDDLSDLVVEHRLGVAIEPGDHVAGAAALERLLDEDRTGVRDRAAALATDMTWDAVAGPLRDFAAATGPLPPRLGDAAPPTASPGPRARGLLTRIVRGAERRAGRS